MNMKVGVVPYDTVEIDYFDCDEHIAIVFHFWTVVVNTIFCFTFFISIQCKGN